MSAPIGIGKVLGGSTVNSPDWYKDFDANEVLLQYQRDWVADASQLKIAEKSRRTGLTWAEAADATLCAGAQRAAGGCNHFYVGSNKEMAREFIDAVAMWAKLFDQAAGEIHEEVLEDEDKDILTFVVSFASGFKVQALSSRPSNLRGMQGNVTIDEAAFHEQLAEVLKAALALTMWGSKVRLISTHNGVENLFNEIIQDSRVGKKDYSVHRITLEDACQQGLYKRICQITKKPWSADEEAAWVAGLLKNTASKEDAEEEYYCVPKSGGGAYLSRALIESRMARAPIFRYEGTAYFNSLAEPLRHAEIADWCRDNLLPILATLNPNTPHCFGEDFARTGDFTVFAPMAIQQDLKRVVPFLVELRNVPFKQQEQIMKYIIDRLPKFQAGAFDARGNGQYLAEAAVDEYGAGRIETVMLSQSWYLDNMPKFKAAFEDDEILVPKDRDVLDDLRALQVIKGIPKLPDGKTGDDKKRHGDAAIALAMAYFASLMDAVDIDFTSVPMAKADWHGRANDDDANDIGLGMNSGGW